MRWIIRIALIAVFVGGAFIFRDRISGAATDLKVGDCFDRPTSGADTVRDVQHHPCTEAHTAEVFLLTKHPAPAGAPVQTNEQLYTYLAQTCIPAYNAYTGAEIQKTDVMDIGSVYPTDKDWNSGKRDILCYAYRTDHGTMTGSVKKTP